MCIHIHMQTQIHMHTDTHTQIRTHTLYAQRYTYIHTYLLQVHTLFSIFVYVSVCVSPISPLEVSLRVLTSLSTLCLPCLSVFVSLYKPLFFFTLPVSFSLLPLSLFLLSLPPIPNCCPPSLGSLNLTFGLRPDHEACFPPVLRNVNLS